MAINLSKGQRVSLDSSMSMARIGLGWDPNEFSNDQDYDLDISAFMLGADGKVRSDADVVFYNNKDWNGHAVWTLRDSLDGRDSDGGEDEQIFIDFSKIPPDIDRIAIAATIHEAEEKHQNFGQVSNSYISVYKMANEFDLPGEQMIYFDLGEEFSIETAIIACEIYRKNGEWKFNAIGGGIQGGLAAVCRKYGINA